MSDYITVAGLVQFDPRTRQAGDKTVRDVVIRAIGSNQNFSITVWPEKEGIVINKGDFLVVDGKHTQSVGQNKEGAQVTYNNMSAGTLFRFAGDGGSAAPQAPKAAAAAASGDDFPF
jgi:hypothetical protein